MSQTKHMYVHPSRYGGRAEDWETRPLPTCLLKVYACPRNMTVMLLRLMFETVHSPNSINELKGDREEDGGFLVSFKTAGQATDILATFDYQWINDARLGIEFVGTPSKGSDRAT